jgi:hypothetical protein
MRGAGPVKGPKVMTADAGVSDSISSRPGQCGTGETVGVEKSRAPPGSKKSISAALDEAAITRAASCQAGGPPGASAAWTCGRTAWSDSRAVRVMRSCIRGCERKIWTSACTWRRASAATARPTAIRNDRLASPTEAA